MIHLTIKNRKKWFLGINRGLNTKKESYEGLRKETSQNVPRGPMDYFGLKTLKAQKTQEMLFTSPLTACKNLDRGLCLGRELSSKITTKSME